MLHISWEAKAKVPVNEDSLLLSIYTTSEEFGNP